MSTWPLVEPVDINVTRTVPGEDMIEGKFK
jgi:hypothetical protein